MSAWVKFVVLWVILLFLPSMTLKASVFILAAIFVAADKLSRSPIRTLLFRVLIKLRLSPKVLPVVCIHTNISLMLTFIVRAPYWLEMEHIEVYVFGKLINEFHWNFCFWMSEWAIFSILAFIITINIGWAKFSFVFVWMVELFYSVMSLLTCISIWAFLSFNCKLTHFWLVYS